MPDWASISKELQSAGVTLDDDLSPQPVAGGDISAAWRVATDNGDLFIKTGPATSEPMFLAEAEGLAEIARSDTLRVPACRAAGKCASGAFLALEWLQLSSPDKATERRLGEQLAAMHHTVGAEFGWHRDNTIGLSPQINTPGDSWVEFFAEQRLQFQLRLATDNGFGVDLRKGTEQLLRRLPALFAGYQPVPSLLHGDLWGGNWGCTAGEPVVFDPAVYYGDRESDLAMTRLFGGFGAAFYDAYEAAWPLAAGSGARQQLYQLYHVLNHLNLFGNAYLGRARTLIDQLIKA